MAWESIDISRGWLPDYVPFGIPKGGLIKAKNLLPYDEKYGPIPGKLDYSSSTISGSSRGCYNMVINDVGYPIIGTTTKLYRLNADKTLTDKTKAATTYACGENQWQFVTYGKWTIATNYADSVQKHTDISHPADLFVDLGGTPPKAKYALMEKGHLILGYCHDGTERPNRLTWSGFENLESYTPDLATGADYQDIPDAEMITGLGKAGNYIGVFHNNSITVGTYIGAPYTFALDYNKIMNIGAIRYSTISIGDYCFFLSMNGIYVFTGTEAISIGEGVERFVINNINLPYSYLINTLHDPVNHLVYWFYPSTGSTTIDKVLIYNYKAKKFTYGEIDIQSAFIMKSAAITLDDLDTYYSSLDDIPYSLDSSRWTAGSKMIAGINPSTSKVCTLTGDALEWDIETGEYGLTGQTIDIEGVRARVNLATGEVSSRVGGRYNEDEVRVYTEWATVNENTGIIDIRTSNRYLSVEVKGTNMDGIQDIEVDAYNAGGL